MCFSVPIPGRWAWRVSASSIAAKLRLPLRTASVISRSCSAGVSRGASSTSVLGTLAIRSPYRFCTSLRYGSRRVLCTINPSCRGV
jgi:hypothetical protein